MLIRIPYSRWLALVDDEGKSVERPQETEASKRRADQDSPRTFVNTNGCLLKVDEDEDGDEWTELLAPRPGCTGWQPRTSCRPVHRARRSCAEEGADGEPQTRRERVNRARSLPPGALPWHGVLP